ncbi:MAG: septation protein A [Elusimicrobiota bacterium]
MKFLFEFFPIILFFIVFKFKGIYAATAAAIAASVIQIAVAYARKRKVEPAMLIGFAVLLVFGGFTLLLRNEAFIKWKPTILYWIFAAVIGGARALYGKNIIRLMLQKQLQVPENVWEKINWSWGGFFALLGGINLFVAYNFSTDVWVNFKLFGLMGLMFIFVIIQSLFLAKYINQQNPESK